MFWKRKPKPIITKEFETKWRIGTKTALTINQLARRFSSDISLSASEDTVNAKSYLDVVMRQSEADRQKDVKMLRELSRGASISDVSHLLTREQWFNSGLKAGSHIRVTVRGPDAAAAMEALAELLSYGSRVDHCVESECPSTAQLAGYTSDRIDYACSKGHTWSVSRKDASNAQQSA